MKTSKEEQTSGCGLENQSERQAEAKKRKKVKNEKKRGEESGCLAPTK